MPRVRATLTRLPKRVLELPGGFDLYQRLVGAPEAKRRFVHDYVRPQLGERVLDVGCGTGALCALMPDGVSYVGVDVDADYVDAARERYGPRAEFVCSPIETYAPRPGEEFDVAIAFGVFHHLDDEQVRAGLQVVRNALKPGGRLVISEPVREATQGRVESFLKSHDRGRFIRTEQEYVRLVESAFDAVRARAAAGTYRIPFTLVVVEGTAASRPSATS